MNYKVSYVRYVEVRVFNLTIRLLKNNAVHINGVPSFVPFASQGVNIVNLGGSLILSTNFGLTVSWNGDAKADVSLCDAYAGYTCGLCGNSDGKISSKFSLFIDGGNIIISLLNNIINQKEIKIMILLIQTIPQSQFL